MKASDVIPAFLAACPNIGSTWQEHLEFWDGEIERGDYNDASVVAHYLVDSFERGELVEFPAAFAVLERCLIEGDQNAQELAVVGIIEDIQNIALHRPFGPLVFYEWLGPSSRVAWDELCAFWQQVAAAKPAGLLEPRATQPAPAIDPSQIEDSTLRRIAESLDRHTGPEGGHRPSSGP
ncbi:MAG: hypothetical protein L0211_05720 [Planctomycetaceae bacterium]|nr:hypothetical protein [Planctomycetaceae bacterium]